MKFWVKRAGEWTYLEVRRVNMGQGVTDHKGEECEQELSRNASQSLTHTEEFEKY